MDANAVLSFTLADSSGPVLNEVFIHNDPPSFYADPDEDVQFLPQLFANYEADTNDKLIFRDSETGKLEKRSASADGTKYRRFAAAATLANGDTFRSMQVAKDVAVSFADGATVGNLGGYLDLRGGAAVGPLANAASSSSTLDFGDAVARVYVGKRADTATIGCKLAGTAGLVKGGSGILALGASAEGVAGGVRVAGGTLEIGVRDGSALHPGRIGGDIRVEAGSRLVLRDTGAISPMSKLYLNDRAWIPSHAHVRLEAGVKAVVKEIFVAGEALPHGWYGSSDSDAQFVDDVHFEGPGMVHAGSFPTMMILK